MRHFFIEKPAIERERATLTGPDARHISTVLRLGPGDTVGLYDGMGAEYEARIDTVSREAVSLTVLREYPSPAESPVRITVAQALLKDRKMDGLLRQLTELGIAEWAPFIASRSVPRPDGRRLASRMDRWQTIAREAAKQSRRGTTVRIHPVTSFEEALVQGKQADMRVVFHEGSEGSLTAEQKLPPRPARTILVMLGPEGGFTDGEIARAEAEGSVIAGLGPRILRAETATVAACTLVQYLFGDMG